MIEHSISWEYLAGFFDGEGTIYIKINDRYGQEIDTRYGYCKCGCGRKTKLATKNRVECGWQRGKPLNYLNGHNTAKLSEFKIIRVTIPQAQTQADVIYDIAGFLQDIGLNFSLLEYDISNCPMCIIQMSKQVDVYEFLSNIVPYLRVKRRQALKAISLLERGSIIKEVLRA